jgi:hypothetical protein
MDEAAAWRRLADQFRKSWRSDRCELRLYASWSLAPLNDHGDHWFIAGSSSECILESFSAAAERAAVLLGQPAGPSTLTHWLDLLKENSPRYQGGGWSESVHGGATVRSETGSINDLCLASAEYCYKLETAAIARRDPSVARIEIVSANMKDRAKARAHEEYLVEKEKDELRRKDSLADAPNLLDGPSMPSGAMNPLPLTHPETIAEQLTRLRKESRLTVDALTNALGIDSRSVERHLAGKTTPRIGHIGAYERTFSDVLKRKVVIEKTPVKRR